PAQMFTNLVEGRPCKDKVLPTTPVFRRSCGCDGGYDQPSFLHVDLSGIAYLISANFPIPLSDARFLVDRVYRNPSEHSIRELLESLCMNGADVFEMKMIINSIASLLSVEDLSRTRIIDTAMEMLPFILDRNTSIVSYEDHSRRNAFNRFNNELIEANTVADISRILEKNAEDLGFERIHIVLSNGERSQLVGTDISFSDNLLVPENSGIVDNGVWVASPLCTESEYMGHILMKLRIFNGSVCEEVRSVVSSALRNSMLFEATRKAQQTAEKAEQARTTFFANVGENLRDPLSDIVEIVSTSGLDSVSKKSIIDKITGANQILDLALSSTDELELDNFTLNLDGFLSSFACYEKTMSLPCVFADENRLRQAIGTIVSSMGDGARIKACMQQRGIRIDIKDTRGSWKADPNNAGLRLAQKIILMHNGTCSMDGPSLVAVLPYPSLAGGTSRPWEDGGVLACLDRNPGFRIPGMACEEVNGSVFSEKRRLPATTGAIYWDSQFKGYNALSSLLCLVSNETYRNLPFICMDCPKSKSLEDAIRSSVEDKGRIVLQVGSATDDLYRWLQDPNVLSCDMSNAAGMCRRNEPGLVIVMMEDPANRISAVVSLLKSIRGNVRISQTPVVVCNDNVDEAFVDAIGDIPNVIVVNTCMLESEEFAMRVRAILGGSQLLATQTGIIVKKAQAYICTHATLQLSRWQVADDVNVSEDYLTRIFKKELGLSPWDYLNRYKVWLAGRLLRNTGMSVNEVSIATGFQDQAYFCRVFKKIKGYSPSRLRSARKSELSKK
ncbi:MAG: helix-turn-helix domain-containing protein, partial [Spirochaetales bacterium]|nr:helix-turn-helix domain-containing protein [Spirochaetales bacterium]